MKRYFILAIACALAMTLIPCAMTDMPKSPDETNENLLEQNGDGTPKGDETITVFMADDEKTVELSMREYVIRAVAAEMPAVYEEEALKAQALASATLARYMALHNKNNKELKGAVISTDSKKYQAYMDESIMKERWGENFEVYYKKLCDAVDETLSYTITYGGEPITAVFHAVSTGLTETAENVWGKAVPYLVSVESEGDSLSPGYRSTLTVSPEEFKSALGLSPGNDDHEGWLGETQYSEAGTLQNAVICEKSFTGAFIRETFDLRSAAIKISFDGENFVFDVTGYGHGVGMSQYGADYYARQGLTWREIIEHYYPGTEISEIKS
ncbi:MAG: stage II sporulation protein D [Clostridia bacterium]|nr:stage II sporulation protein D [Clostridia bacterium]